MVVEELEREGTIESEPPVGDPVVRLAESWPMLAIEERLESFEQLSRDDAEEFFSGLGARDQAYLILALPPTERRAWLRQLAPDDAVDLLQEVPPEDREGLLPLLDKVTRREVSALLAYAEDEAGGLMSPRFVRLRSEMSVDEALVYLRRQARRPIETINYGYVLDHNQVLLGVVSFRDLLLEAGTKVVSDIMTTDVIAVSESLDQEEVSRLLKQNNLLAIPVIDEEGRLQGIVTVDDVIEAIEEEVTEDIQKIGGTEALDAPYMEVSFWNMIRKRAGWLSVLFVGEMFTASAMAHYEEEIAKAVVLATFIPLVISSGGNCGSQASTLVVRAVALDEIRPGAWPRVLFREIASGLCLGLILGTLGFLRVLLWPNAQSVYGQHYILLAATLFFSLIGVTLWGTVTGSMLPLLLRRIGWDPASASAPFVATVVDVTGLVIYFTVASLLLGGLLL